MCKISNTKRNCSKGNLKGNKKKRETTFRCTRDFTSTRGQRDNY